MPRSAPGTAGSTEPTEIEQRIAKLRPPGQLVIYRDLRVGQKGAVAERVRMGFDQHMGDSYPFTLADKLKALVALAHHGYTPDAIEPFDLMPGTAQVETLVRLRRLPCATRRAR